MFIAALNIRPESVAAEPVQPPRSAPRFRAVCLGPLEKDQKMGPGYNELIPEMFRITGSQST